MLNLVTGSNNLTVSVQEKVTIANPQFVFVFVNDHTGKKAACYAGSETLLDHGRSQFTITIGINDPLNSKVLLTNYGSFHYYVYQIANHTTFDYTNIDTTDLRTLTGLCDNSKSYWAAPAVTNNIYKDVRTSVFTYGQ